LAAGKGEDAVLGYGDIFLHNYALKERLYDALSEEEMEAHSILTRIFMNLRKEGLKTKLKWDVKYDYENQPLPKVTEKDFEVFKFVQSLAPTFSVSQDLGAILPDNSKLQAYTAEL
jgi:hypothetical protein